MKELEDIIWQLECIYRRTGDLDVGIEMLRLRFFKHNQERKMKKYRYLACVILTIIAMAFLIKIFTYLK